MHAKQSNGGIDVGAVWSSLRMLLQPWRRKSAEDARPARRRREGAYLGSSRKMAGLVPNLR